MNKTAAFSSLKKQIKHCTHCEKALPFKPRPFVQIHPNAKIVIVGQAPSLTVQKTGILWNDASGKRLMDWLQITPTLLYDPTNFAILPMGFCYPGKNMNGDLPPPKACAPLWHQKIFAFLRARLILLVGSHAQTFYLQDARKETLTATVRSWKTYLPRYIPLPHPSPLNNGWLRKNPWFIKENLPQLQKIVKKNL